jgi:hypothetical protein
LFSGTVKNRLVFWNCQKFHCFLELSKIALFSGTAKNSIVFPSLAPPLRALCVISLISDSFKQTIFPHEEQKS